MKGAFHVVEVYICQLPKEKSQAKLGELLLKVPKERQKHIRRFYHLDDAYRTIIGDYLLDHVLKQRTGKTLKDITLKRNAYGKPYLPDYPFIQFNISHSGKYVVCAVHNQDVGIDIEEIQTFDLLLAKQLFTVDEYQMILNSNDRNHACYEIWTMKESYTKAIGKGLVIPLDAICIRKHVGNLMEVVSSDEKELVTNFICKQYAIHTDYKLTVCARMTGENMFHEHPTEMNFDQLC